MKKLLCLVALAGLCGQPSYGMEKDKSKHDKECTHCINVGPCNWGLLAAQLGTMHNGPVQPAVVISPQIKKQKTHSDTKSTTSSDTHCSEAGLDDQTSDAGSLNSWEQGSFNGDIDLDSYHQIGKQKKD